jgi:glycosyltransferase involved in cell wall biosynthesis
LWGIQGLSIPGIQREELEGAMRVYINANNVYQGGGKRLLLALLDAVRERQDVTVLLDTRLEGLKDGRYKVKRVFPSVVSRLRSEIWLAREVKNIDVLLVFGNLPPLLRSAGKVTVFLQNRYLVDSRKLSGFPLKTRIRISIERFWVRIRKTTVDRFVVQTATMESLLGQSIGTKVPIAILSFIDNYDLYFRGGSVKQKKTSDFDFLYVASAEDHKNHRNLIEAWCLLARRGQFPSLRLTVDPIMAPALCRWIDIKKLEFNLLVENVGAIPFEQVKGHYEKARALIYPSDLETIGLPLVEARQFGLPILAGELDYVRDVVDPEQTFDPSSPMSIARAVSRFLGVELDSARMQSAASFLDTIVSGKFDV